MKMAAFFQVSKRRSGKHPWQKANAWLRNFITLSYLLGITWIIGFTVKFHPVLEYIFVFLNASVGVFILLYMVVFNGKIREASQRAITRQTITSKFSSIKVSSMWKTDTSSGYSSGIGTMERDSSGKLSSKGDSFSSLGNTHYQDSHKTPIRKRNSNPSMIS